MPIDVYNRGYYPQNVYRLLELEPMAIFSLILVLDAMSYIFWIFLLKIILDMLLFFQEITIHIKWTIYSWTYRNSSHIHNGIVKKRNCNQNCITHLKHHGRNEK